MAINFAAANMAGYNNPQIEVFTAVMDDAGLVSAPSKTILINCMRSGSIPVIMLTTADRISGYILHLVDWDTSVGGVSMDFSIAYSSVTKIEIRYPENDNEPPVIVAQ